MERTTPAKTSKKALYNFVQSSTLLRTNARRDFVKVVLVLVLHRWFHKPRAVLHFSHTAKRLKAMGSQALQKALWLVLAIAPWFPDECMFLPWWVWSTRNHNLQDKGNSITWLIVLDFSVYEGDFIVDLPFLNKTSELLRFTYTSKRPPTVMQSCWGLRMDSEPST